MTTTQLDALAHGVGRTVRSRRLDQGRSLTELARACGLSKTILGRIERGEGNPSLETLWKLAGALAVPLSALLEADDRPRARRVPSRSAVPLDDPSGLRAWLVHADVRERRTELFELALPAGTLRESPAHLPGTEELVVCLEGELSVGPLDAEEALGPGDAVWLAADAPHVYRALSDARALNWMLYPPAAG